MKLVRKTPIIKITKKVTIRTLIPLFFIFLSKLSTDDNNNEVNKNAKTSFKITSDIKGQINHIKKLEIIIIKREYINLI